MNSRMTTPADQSEITDRTFFIRCGDCLDDYVAVQNLMRNSEPLWSSPKKKRGGCQHDPQHAEVYANGRWNPSGEPIKLRGEVR